MIRFLRWRQWTRWRLHHGSKFWAYLAVGASVLRFLHRRFAEPEARATIELRPGEHLEVRVTDPPGR